MHKNGKCKQKEHREKHIQCFSGFAEEPQFCLTLQSANEKCQGLLMQRALVSQEAPSALRLVPHPPARPVHGTEIPPEFTTQASQQTLSVRQKIPVQQSLYTQSEQDLP